MYIAMVGGILLFVGNLLLLTNPRCGKSAEKNELTTGGYDSVCPVEFLMFLPFILGSMGASVYFSILFSSISYLAINSIQGFAFGLAFSFINVLHVIVT